MQTFRGRYDTKKGGVTYMGCPNSMKYVNSQVSSLERFRDYGSGRVHVRWKIHGDQVLRNLSWRKQALVNINSNRACSFKVCTLFLMSGGVACFLEMVGLADIRQFYFVNVSLLKSLLPAKNIFLFIFCFCTFSSGQCPAPCHFLYNPLSISLY